MTFAVIMITVRRVIAGSFDKSIRLYIVNYTADYMIIQWSLKVESIWRILDEICDVIA